VLRRTAGDGARVVHFGDVEVDVERRTVTRAGAEVRVTPAEYNLLLFFLQNVDRVLTRDLILNSVWGYEYYPNTRTVDAHVVRLRQKFEKEPTMPKHFVTVHGVGYRFLP
jgi:DNA-binding response OmpR family regulator